MDHHGKIGVNIVREANMDDSLTAQFRFRHLDPFQERWPMIRRYNDEILAGLPAGAKDFLFSDWHYNYGDPRSPHDSWVKSIEFQIEPKAHSARTVRLQLLGAFHDRVIQFEYVGVTDLSIQGNLLAADGRTADWLYDEVHLCDSGLIEHVIEFEQAVMKVEGADLTCSFFPANPTCA